MITLFSYSCFSLPNNIQEQKIYKGSSHLKNSHENIRKTNVNQSRRQREGFPSAGCWNFSLGRVFGEDFWAASWVLDVKKVWVLFSLGPFPKRPLRFSIFNPKTRVVSPLHVPVSSSQWFIGWICFLVAIRSMLCFCDEYLHVCVFEIVWGITYVLRNYVYVCAMWTMIMCLGFKALKCDVSSLYFMNTCLCKSWCS